MDNTHAPQISVVVAIVSDTAVSHCNLSPLVRCLEALANQVAPPTMEIIVPYHSRVMGIEGLRAQFPHVRFFQISGGNAFHISEGDRERMDRLRAEGMAAARGDILALIEDVGQPDKHWSSRVVEAHRQGFAAIGGAMENGLDRPLNWAVYFCDFYKYQNPVPEGESSFVSDANVSYKRSALESVRPVWREAFHETEVNWALTLRGEKLALSPGIIVYQRRGQLHLSTALKERFIWARYFAARRSNLFGKTRRAVYTVLSPVVCPLILLRMAMSVRKKGRCMGAFVKALPLTAMLTLIWSCGEFMGYLTARPSGANVGKCSKSRQPCVQSSS